MALRILLADDSMTAQNMGKKILTDAGFDVVTVSNGAAAVKKLAEATPDIAILDVYMPGYTGLEVCERLKSVPASAGVPVLLSVGKMEPFRPEDGMKVKADGVIIKPFEATDLVTVVQKLADRCYGAVSEPTPPPPVAAPAQATEAAEEEEDILEETAPVQETAEGLQTFTPELSEQKIAQEPSVEFTSVPKVGDVPEEPIDGLMPTSLDAAQTNAPEPQVSVEEPLPVPAVEKAAPEETPLEDLLDELPEAAMEEASLKEVPGEEVSKTANWTAIESEVPDQEIDLEAEMQAMTQQEPASVVEDSLGELLATEPAPEAPESPFLAPLGKTSFDELDAVMEQAAAGLSNEHPLAEEAAPIPDLSTLDEQALSPSEAVTPQPAEEPLQAEPMEVLGGDPLEIPVETGEPETPESALPESLPTLEAAPTNPAVENSVDSLEVLDLDSTENAESALDNALAYYGLTDEGPEQGLHNPIEEATDEPLFSVMDELQPAAAESAASIEEPLVDHPAADDSDVLDNDIAAEPAPMEETMVPVAPETTAVVEQIAPTIAVTAAVAAAPAMAAITTACAPDQSEANADSNAVVNAMVERVVGRVVDRLKPILVVMVEEIVAEAKKQ